MLRPAEVRELPLYFVLHVAGFRPPGAESGIRFQFMHCLFPSVGAEQEDAETVDGAMPVLISKSDSVTLPQLTQWDSWFDDQCLHNERSSRSSQA